MPRSHGSVCHSSRKWHSVRKKNKKKSKKDRQKARERVCVVVRFHAMLQANKRGLALRGSFRNRKRMIQLLFSISCKPENKLKYLGYQGQNYLLVRDIPLKDNPFYVICYAEKKDGSVHITSIWDVPIYESMAQKTLNKRPPEKQFMTA